MARYQNNPFSNVTEQDYANYTSWPQVVLPDGQVMYQVPGNPGYVLDPVASAASGRKVFRQNPKGAIEEQQKAQQLQDEAIKQQQFNQSPLGQLLPVGAGTAGMIAASQFAPVDPVSAAAAEVLKQQTLQQGAGAAGSTLAGSAATGATGAIPAAGTVAAPTGVTIAPAGTAASSAAAPSMFALKGIGSAGNVLLPAVGAFGAYDLYSSNRGARNRPVGALQGAASGAAMGSYFGPWGTGIGAVLGGLYGGTQHESTRDVAKRHTQQLLGESENPVYQAYVSGMREQFKEAPKGKAFAGKYDTFEQYKKAGLEASDLTGVMGNIETYGEEWANLSQPQREAITQANIESGLYNSKKGEVLITDKNKALENKNNVLKGFQVGAQTTAPASPLAAAAAQGATAIPRPVVPQQPGFVRR